MKKTLVLLCLAALVLAAFQSATVSSARASVLDSPQDVLISEPWQFSGGGPDYFIIFNRDGTFKTQGKPELSGRWHMVSGMYVPNSVTLVYPDKLTGYLTMPLDPKGTKGLNRGYYVTATLVTPAAMNAALAPSPTPVVSQPTPAPAETEPTPAPAITRPAPAPVAVAMTDPDKIAAAAMLVFAPWSFTGNNWACVRTFNKDGTFTTTPYPYEDGTWQIVNNVIVLNFPYDGHKDTINLPLNAKGTSGVDKNGIAFTAVMQNPAGTAPAPLSSPAASVASVADSTPQPAPSPEVASTPQAAPAEDQTPQAALALLLSGPWKISRKDRSDVRVFTKDGLFTSPGNPDGNGKWTISKDFVILIFPTGHKDALTLPLNSKGTEGYADNGDTLNAVLLNPAAANNVPASTPVPAPVPPPPVSRPVPPPRAGVVRQNNAAATALLVSGPWKITAASWFAIRNFDRDGTFTTVAHPNDRGQWGIGNGQVVLAFEDGHRDTLSLPVDPKGTAGRGSDGTPFNAVRGTPAPAPSGTVIQSEMDSFFHSSSASSTVTAQEKAAAAALLVSAPWKIIGSGWAAVRVFARDGTFTTPEKTNEYGLWKIANDKIEITLADGHVNSLLLPLDPKGSDGVDQDRAPLTAILQDSTAGTATPAPAPAGAEPGTPPPAATPRPPQGPTPPPFGTENPG